MAAESWTPHITEKWREEPGLSKEELEKLMSDPGQETLRHQMWRMAGFPAGVADLPESDEEEEEAEDAHPLKWLIQDEH